MIVYKNFFTKGPNRISIYKHQGTEFILLGRYSDSPQFSKTWIRKYSDKEGAISCAWSNGVFSFTNAPIWSRKNGNSNWTRYMQSNTGLSKERCQQITMHSRSLYASVIKDPSRSSNPEGVIVFESMDPVECDPEKISALLSAHGHATLTLLRNMKSLTRKVEL